MSLYRGFTTQEEIDQEYSPMATAADGEARVQAWMTRGQAVTAELDCHLGLKFGPTRDEQLDVFPAGANAPIHVFIHGGYWRRFSARDHAFLARPLVQAGITTVINNYALCPKVSLDEIVRQTRAAIAWAYAHAADFGADPARLTISGHSAGGHLVGMALLTDWEGDYGLPADLIKGGLAISGLFDLGFLPFSYIQPKVQASWDQVRRLSPQFHIPPCAPPCHVAVGGKESPEFRRQSRDFHAAWHARGLAGTYLEPEGKDHFTVLEEIEDPSTELHRTLVAMAHGR